VHQEIPLNRSQRDLNPSVTDRSAKLIGCTFKVLFFADLEKIGSFLDVIYGGSGVEMLE